MKNGLLFLFLTLSFSFPLSAGDEKVKAGEKSAPAGEEKTSDAVVIKAKVIDLVCYLKDGKKALTENHLQCAQVCFSRGLPAALLEEKTGTLYLPIKRKVPVAQLDANTMICSLMEHTPLVEKLKDSLGKTITVKGFVSDSPTGIKRIEIAELKLAE